MDAKTMCLPVYLLLKDNLPIIKDLFVPYWRKAKAVLFSMMLGISHGALATENQPDIHNPLFQSVLTDQNGHDLPLANYQGKTVLLNFIFVTCGSTCPLQTRQLVEVQKKIPKDKRKTIRFLSITVDPQHDTPEKLKTYAKTMGADLSDWAFATGKEPVIASITKHLHAFDPSKAKPKPDDHSNQLYLYNKQGIILQVYSGDPVDVPRLAREIQELDQLVK